MVANEQAIDWQAFDQWTAKRGLHIKFDGDEVLNHPRLQKAAYEFLSTYQGTFSFVIDLQKQQAEGKKLTMRQLAGALNVYLADLRRKQQRGESSPTLDLSPTFKPIRNGMYTIVYPEADKAHFTIRLVKPSFGNFTDGTQVVQYLRGPMNERDYTSVGFLQDGEFKVWKRYQGHPVIQRVEEALRIVCTSDDPGAFGLAYAMESGNCCRCGLTLTVPASLNRGMGPICAAKVAAEEA